MAYATTVRAERFSFDNLSVVFAKANEEKSGDKLAGIAARSEQERVAAKHVLADVCLSEIIDNPLIDPDKDEVSRLILVSLDREKFHALASATVGEFRDYLLDEAQDGDTLSVLHRAITPEVAAAVTKLMSNKDLVLAASKIRTVTRCRNTMGQRGVLGIRLQPNHPADDLGAILLSTIDGLLFGCGDAVLGVNPATESVETVSRILHGLNRLIEVYTYYFSLLPGHKPQTRALGST